jgi:transmembrane sensor
MQPFAATYLGCQMKVPANISALIEKYQSGTATPEELRQLNEWYHSFDDDLVEVAAENAEDQQIKERIKHRLMQTIQQPVQKKQWGKWRIPAAASIFLIAASAIYFLFLQPSSPKQNAAQKNIVSPVLNNDVAPGGNKALLTLADGSTIILDSVTNGVISTQGNIAVQKLDNGLLAYTINGKTVTENDEAFYNTITTPRGGQYQITLSDGTKVWLNAASSIRFPVVFKGTERRVTVTGETYFEVAHNSAMPFKIKVVSSEVEVIGTHFNINAYDDEASIKTTLLEGKVKVSVPAIDGAGTARFLSPGQQSSVNKNGNINIQNSVDTEEAVAWKNGRFQFKSADLKSILRQIARWYDVEVQYKGNVDLHFSGQLTRSDNVSKVFEKLKLTGEVNFKVEGKKIIVSR